MKMKKIVLIPLFLVLFVAAFTACKDDDLKYEMTDDLFHPKLLQDPLVETNTILLVWYEIYEAKDYTVEISLTANFQEIYRAYENYPETILLIDDIPYATKFYIRLRSNSPVGEKHNSEWTGPIEVSTPKRVVNRVLSVDKDNDLGKDFVILRWSTDYESNPVDSIGLVPATAGVPFFGKTLTAQDLANGYLLIEGLVPNTSYTANIYNTQEPSVYDQPYNEVRFRTAGDPVDPIRVSSGTDLTRLFYESNNNPEIPDGAVFLLEAGGEFILNNQANAEAWDPSWDGVAPNKGFILMGDSQAGLARPKVYLRHWFSLSGDASIMAFENIDFYGVNTSLDNTPDNTTYLVNFDSDISLDLFSIYNCTFTNVGRGIIRTKEDNYKNIQNIEITDSRFYDICQNGYNFMSFGSTNSDQNDAIENIYIEGCTFANTNGREWITGTSVITLQELTVINCTFYQVAVSAALVNMPSSRYDAIMEYNLFAGETLSGSTLRNHSGSISAMENYTTTTESTSATPIGAIYLGTPDEPFNEADLFQDAPNYDFTIIDYDSPVFENYVGDPYWL